MLNPNNDRIDYGQSLAPPLGYSLDFAVGTTYSLDLDALVGACIALGLSAETDSVLMNNPIFLLEALRSTGDKVALFCEGGQIKVPSNESPLYILLEKMVFQVVTAKRRDTVGYPSFHPKFWLVRYVDEKKNKLYRLMVLSRNLTFDRSWDVMFVMDGIPCSKRETKNAPVGAFLSYLADNMTYDGSDDEAAVKNRKIKELAKEISNVRFELDSKVFTDFEFLPTGFKKSGKTYSSENEGFAPLFRDSSHDTLVMSPFLSNSVIKGLVEKNRYLAKANYILFTRRASLEKLRANDCMGFRCFVMKDLVIDGESEISEESHVAMSQDIHAKLYLVRKNSDVYFYLGSMNASHKSTVANVEFMIRLKSKESRFSMKTLAQSLFGDDEKGAFNPFEEADIREQTAADDKEGDSDILDGFVKRINRMNPVAAVTSDGERYDVNIHFEDFVPLELSATVRPVLSKKTEPFGEDVLFKGLSLIHLSSFYVISVSDGERTVERVIKIPTEGIPDGREKAVVSSIIKDEDSFYRYVSFLLGDNYALSAKEVGFDMGLAGENDFKKKTFELPSLYEKMLKTAATDPDRLKEIEYLLKAVSADGVIPEDFEKLYGTFKKAVKL